MADLQKNSLNMDNVNILLVDDQPGKLLTTQTILADLGCNIITAPSGRAALQHLLKHEFALVLLDVVMPDRNGFQVCRELKCSSEFQGIPVILVTSKDTASDKYWGEQQGADAYVTKPFTKDELLRAVRRFA